MEDDQNGVERLVIKFVNADSLVKEESIASDSDKANWKNMFANVMGAIKKKPETSAGGSEDEPAF